MFIENRHRLRAEFRKVLFRITEHRMLFAMRQTIACQPFEQKARVVFRQRCTFPKRRTPILVKKILRAERACDSPQRQQILRVGEQEFGTSPSLETAPAKLHAFRIRIHMRQHHLRRIAHVIQHFTAHQWIETVVLVLERRCHQMHEIVFGKALAQTLQCIVPAAEFPPTVVSCHHQPALPKPDLHTCRQSRIDQDGVNLHTRQPAIEGHQRRIGPAVIDVSIADEQTEDSQTHSSFSTSKLTMFGITSAQPAHSASNISSQ